MKESLFERLGGNERITAIASDLVDLHMVNETIKTRFANSDLGALKHAAATFSLEQVAIMYTRARICWLPTRG
jgi:hemoglobin